MKTKDGKPKPKPKKIRQPRSENTILNEWMAPEKLELISYWARDGYTEQEIAEKMGICLSTFQNYRKKSLELNAAVRDGKEFIDYSVESALLSAARGSTTTELKVIVVYEENKTIPAKTIKAKTTKELPPNVLACQTWLFNRKRDKWKRNRENEITIEEDKSINITIKRAAKTIEVEEVNE